MTRPAEPRTEVGTFTVPIEIGDTHGERFERLDALVDTGATTTVIPGAILKRLGILPTKHETFEYAGGEPVELGMAEAKARVEGRETTTWVIFGQEETSALLGAYTLEGVFLGVDPYGRRLIPVQGLLKQSSLDRPRFNRLRRKNAGHQETVSSPSPSMGEGWGEGDEARRTED